MLKIWDTAGQERFKNICKNYYRNANGILVVFDLSNPVSFENVKKWLTEIVANTDGANVVKILVGNKSDLSSAVSEEEALEYAKATGMDLVRTSAKTGSNVDELFTLLAKKCVGFCKAEEEEPEEYVVIGDAANPAQPSAKKGGCC
eukprot:gnl/Chilomastix_caulleri/2338.p1 GENE.gnl/Chilomastix_caulleri/2338~~gnl/Chilomastix_caulleri/2338.p1  ORF type:complete len:146 (+),score=46.83 gnl/Chilomastix_caulleri/2338:59-496(+)